MSSNRTNPTPVPIKYLRVHKENPDLLATGTLVIQFIQDLIEADAAVIMHAVAATDMGGDTKPFPRK